MLHDSTQRLILKLCEMTDRGEIAWRESAGAEAEVSIYDTEGYAVEVKAVPPGLRILRADGREVERVDDGDLESAPWPLGPGTFATNVQAMAVRAHRVARGAEAAIASILSALASPPRSPSRVLATAASIDPQSTGTVSAPAPTAAAIAETTVAAAKKAPGPVVESRPATSNLMRVLSLTRSQPVARFGPSFGAISSFTRTPAAHPHPVQPSSPAARSAQPATAEPSRGDTMASGLVMTGMHAVARQTPVRESIALTHAAKPSPASADVYKPWI